MNKDPNYKEPDVIILSSHEKIDAEEYLQDEDQVYRKKGEKSCSKSSSLFWMRLGCFAGLIILSFVLFFKFIVLTINCIHALVNRLSEPQINQLFLKNLANYLSLSKIFVALCVGVINPFWGKRIMNFFFSMSDNSEKNSYWHRSFNFSV